jgi:hypothetical protein
MSSQKKIDSKIRILRAESRLIDAIEQTAKEYPEITTAETGAAILRILTMMNNDEIEHQENLNH